MNLSILGCHPLEQMYILFRQLRESMKFKTLPFNGRFSIRITYQMRRVLPSAIPSQTKTPARFRIRTVQQGDVPTAFVGI